MRSDTFRSSALSLLLGACFLLPSRGAAQGAPPTPDSASTEGRLVPGAKIRVTFGQGTYRIRETGTFREVVLDTVVYSRQDRQVRRVPRGSMDQLEVARQGLPSAGHVVRGGLIGAAGSVLLAAVSYGALSASMEESGFLVESPNYFSAAITGAALGGVIALATGHGRWVPAAMGGPVP